MVNVIRNKNTKIVSVFGSGYPIEGTIAYEQARNVGKLIAQQGWIVCNGGYGGIMEASARGANEEGGKTIGVTCTFYRSKPNPYITEEISTSHVAERLLKLIELANGYIVLQGGTGTLVELATVWEYLNKSVIDKRPVIVIGDFWKPIVDTVHRALVEEGEEERLVLQFASSPDEAISILKRSFTGM